MLICLYKLIYQLTFSAYNYQNFKLFYSMEVKPSFQDIIQSETPVLVDFYADWCLVRP